MVQKLFNIALRLTTLVTKLGLILYITKFLGLHDLGTYGLVAAFVALSIPLIGMRLEYVFSRDIVDKDDQEAARIIKDEFLFYGLNYMVTGLLCVAFSSLFLSYFSKEIFFYMILLCILEGFSTLMTAKLTSRHRPIMGNIVFFIRSALWVFPFVILAYIDETYRTVETILIFWLIGNVLSLVFGLYLWKDLPWLATLKEKTDFRLILSKVKVALPLWIAGVCLAGSNYVDRFIVEHFLDRELVGVISFYGAFLVAINALVGSGVFSFSYPKMISFSNKNQKEELKSLTQQTTRHALFVSLIISISIGIAVPVLGMLIDRPELGLYKAVLYIMMTGGIIKITSQSLEFYFYALNKDWAVWSANLVLLSIMLIASILMTPVFGLYGVAYAYLTSCVGIAVWRLYCLYRVKKELQN